MPMFNQSGFGIGSLAPLNLNFDVGFNLADILAQEENTAEQTPEQEEQEQEQEQPTPTYSSAVEDLIAAGQENPQDINPLPQVNVPTVAPDLTLNQDNLALAGGVGSGMGVPTGQPYQDAAQNRLGYIEQVSQFNPQNQFSEINQLLSSGALEDDALYGTVDRLNAFLGSQEYSDGLSGYIQQARDSGISTANLSDLELTQMYDEALGLGTSFGDAGTTGQGIRRNAETGEYESYDWNSDGVLGDVVPALVMSAITAGAGAGFAPLLGSATGLGTAGSSALSNALVNGTATALRGGETSDILRSATLSGISGYAQGLASEMSEIQASLEAAQAAGDTAQVAALTSQANDLQNVINTVANVDNAAQFANAVDNGANPLQAAAQYFGEGIVDFIDIDDTLNTGLANIFNEDVADALTSDSAFTNVLMDQAAGRNLGDSLADRYGQTVVDQLNLGTQNGNAFALGVIEAVAEYGENGVASDALVNGVREYVDQGGNLDDVKEFLGELVPNLPDMGGEGVDLGWIEDGLRELGRDFDDSVLQPIKEFFEENAPDIDFDLPDLPDIDLPDLPDVNLPDIDLPDGPDIDLPDVDLPDGPSLSGIDLMSLLGLLGGGASQASPQETVESEEGEFVDLQNMFDLETMTLLGLLDADSQDNELSGRNYNQGGIVNRYGADELINYLEGR